MKTITFEINNLYKNLDPKDFDFPILSIQNLKMCGILAERYIGITIFGISIGVGIYKNANKPNNKQ